MDMTLDEMAVKNPLRRNGEPRTRTEHSFRNRGRTGRGATGNRFNRKPSDVGSEQGSKILLSNLNYKVTDSDLKELFSTIGPLKKVALAYDANGKSQGTAEISFVRSQDAQAAAKKYDNVSLDGRPMVIEIVAKVAPSISSRLSIGKNESNTTNGDSLNNNASSTERKVRGRGGRRIGRGGRNSGGEKGPKKTAEELDEEMNSYMSGGTKKVIEEDVAMG